MSNIQFIKDLNEICINSNWLSTPFKNKIVNSEGHQYQVVEKKEHSFSALTRFGRGFLGVILLICTLFIAFCSKSVRNLFKSKESVRFAILTVQEISGLLQLGGGRKKNIQKALPFNDWLEQDYSNKKSPTYLAYKALGLNNPLFIGIRGDGDCGYRAIIASLLLELAKHTQCQSKFNTLIGRLDHHCPNQLKNTQGDPRKLALLLNDDLFMNNFIRELRFLSNDLLIKDFDSLPEEVKMQVEFGDGALALGREKYLRVHATIDVENTQNMPAYFFADIPQIWRLAERLGFAYWIGIVNEGQKDPEAPNTYAPQDPLLTINMLCRDKRHFDIILPS